MKLSISTRVLLVLLQLAIGWHLFYEGVWKFNNPSWSSKGYLKNVPGPLAQPLRWTSGDPDVGKGPEPTEAERAESLKARMTPLPPVSTNPSEEEAQRHKRMPPPVRAEWDAYLARFVKHYKLDQDETREQRHLIERDYENLQSAFVEWLLEGKKKIKRPNFPNDVTVPIKERLREYTAKLDEVAKLEGLEEGTFHVSGTPKVKQAREEAVAIRKELTADLDTRFDMMKQALRDDLTYDQRRMPDVPPPAAASDAEPPQGWWADLDKQAGEGKLLPIIDAFVKWGLVIIGGCLLLGLGTRTACLMGAALLLTFYLSMPPFPGLPEPAMSEGHYLFVNKNLIEMLALLALMTTRPGDRYGLDVWIGAAWKKVFPPKTPKTPVATPTQRS